MQYCRLGGLEMRVARHGDRDCDRLTWYAMDTAGSKRLLRSSAERQPTRPAICSCSADPNAFKGVSTASRIAVRCLAPRAAVRLTCWSSTARVMLGGYCQSWPAPCFYEHLPFSLRRGSRQRTTLVGLHAARNMQWSLISSILFRPLNVTRLLSCVRTWTHCNNKNKRGADGRHNYLYICKIQS